MKYIIAGLLVIVCIGAFVFTRDRKFQVEPRPMQYNYSSLTDNMEITIDLQLSGLEDVDNQIMLLKDTAAQEMQQMADEIGTVNAPYQLDMRSQRFASAGLGLDSIVVTTYEYTDGAHGNTVVNTWVYSSDGSTYNLDNILVQDQRTLDFLADRLEQTVLLYAETSDIDWIRDAGSQWTTYQDVFIDGNTLEFVFEPYSVGPYALGMITMSIPFDTWALYGRGWTRNFVDTTSTTTDQ